MSRPQKIHLHILRHSYFLQINVRRDSHLLCAFGDSPKATPSSFAQPSPIKVAVSQRSRSHSKLY